MRIPPTRRNQRLIGGALLLLALSLRLWGLTWGAPARIDLHPDEREHVMSHALAVTLADPDPKFLNYPSFLIYLIAIANGVLSRLGVVTEEWQSFVVARGIVALFGSLTALAAFVLGFEVAGELLAAALAGLWVALLPLHVWESHFAVTDVVMTFWIVVVLAGSVRMLRDGGLGITLVTGAALGFAIASKYTAALVGISPLVASLLARRPLASVVGGLALLGATALGFCFLGTPFSFIHFGQLREAMAFEYSHVHSLHYGFSLPAAGWQYHKYVYELCASFPFSLGFALYASVAAGTLWALARLGREHAVLLAFAILFFAIVGHWTFTPLRYQMPVLVVGAVFAGLWQGSWLGSESKSLRAIAAVSVIVTLLYTLVFVVETTGRLRQDTRIQAAHWLDETLKPGQRLLLCGFAPYAALPTDPRIGVDVENEGAIGKVGGRSDFDLLEITSLLYWRHERHRHPAFLPAYQHLREGRTPLQLVKRFEADFLNRDLYRRLDPMFAGYFISPTLEFYAPNRGARG